MAEHTEYTGEIVEHDGWKGSLYQLRKDDGSLTEKGLYENVFKIGEDRFVVFPYYHDGDRPWIMSAAEVMDLIATK